MVSKMAGPRVTVDPGTSLCSFPASSILLSHLPCPGNPGNVNPKDGGRKTTDTNHHGQINLIKASFFLKKKLMHTGCLLLKWVQEISIGCEGDEAFIAQDRDFPNGAFRG